MITISVLNLSVGCMLNSSNVTSQATRQMSDVESVMAGNSWCLFYGKFSILSPSLPNDVSHAGGLVTIFPPSLQPRRSILSACSEISGMEGEFQQRGQKNLANLLQMCLLSFKGEHCAALAGENKGSARRKKVQWLTSKKYHQSGTAGSVWGGNTAPHAHSFHFVWAELNQCKWVILKGKHNCNGKTNIGDL